MSAAEFALPPSATPRQRILLTAHALFYRDGIRATGIDRVIAESGVAKATFYRHFPSKNDLILAYLDHRHQLWIEWFKGALARHGNTPRSLLAALAEWFGDPSFRGCAFINSVGELAMEIPAIAALTRAHKQQMAEVIASLLPPGADRDIDARSLALAVDGAIVRAQSGEPLSATMASLERIVSALPIATHRH